MHGHTQAGLSAKSSWRQDQGLLEGRERCRSAGVDRELPSRWLFPATWRSQNLSGES